MVSFDLPCSFHFILHDLALTSYFSCAVSSVIAAGDLEPPSGDDEDENLTEPPPAEAASTVGKKRKESTPARGNVAQPETSGMVLVF